MTLSCEPGSKSNGFLFSHFDGLLINVICETGAQHPDGFLFYGRMTTNTCYVVTLNNKNHRFNTFLFYLSFYTVRDDDIVTLCHYANSEKQLPAAVAICN